MITKSNFRKALYIFRSDGVKALLRKLVTKTRSWLSNEPNEHMIAFQVLKDTATARVMIDVGASTGNSLAPFAEAGWRVYAFEPDPRNRAVLEQTFGDYLNVVIDPRAVSNEPRENAAFYSSEISQGISGLTPFDPSHRQTATVEITTLSEYIQEYGIQHVDFLKVDTEGYDLKVLEGFPWSSLRPSIVIAEIDEKKTIPMGYSLGDLVSLLREEKYHTLLSEWQPLASYGSKGHWERFVEFKGETLDIAGWGNIIGVDSEELLNQFRSYCISKYYWQYLRVD